MLWGKSLKSQRGFADWCGVWTASREDMKSELSKEKNSGGGGGRWGGEGGGA